jgi:di/tricarboxylate transporter
VALVGVAVLLAVGVLGTSDVLAVFSNPAPITVGALFVLTAALERTGVIERMGRIVAKVSGRSPALALGAMMLGVMAISAFINNTPVVVILTPVVISLAQTLKLAPSRLLIPLSYATILGGTTTLIGSSTNILVDGVAQKAGLAPFGMFEMTGAGVIYAIVGALYLVLIGRRFLPDRETLAQLLPKPGDRHFFAEVLIPADSPLVGKALKEAGFTAERGLLVVDVIRDGARRPDLAALTLAAGDRLMLRSSIGDLLALREAGDVAFGGQGVHAIEPVAAQETIVMEAMVGPESRFDGRRVARLLARPLFGVRVLAIHRQGESVVGDFGEVRLQVGDTLLIEGPPRSLTNLVEDRDLVNLVEPAEKPLRRDKWWIAVGAIVAVIALSAFEVLPIAALAIIAAVAVMALRCLEPDEAYGAIRWSILMLIFAMLAIGAALEKSGAARLIVTQFAGLVQGLGPLAVLAAVYLITMALTEFVSNNAAAILLTPIAIGLAQQIGVDPRPFAVAVMFAASASFATPIGYQTNTFVYNAGGYRFTDFVKVGLPLNLILWATAIFVIPTFWPLG